MSANHSIKDWVLLSSFLDGELNDRDKQKLEKLLRANPDLQDELEKMRQTRAMLRSMPRKKAPRNFTLSAEMVAARKPGFLVPLFSYSSAASAIVALVLLFIQLMPGFFATSRSGALARDAQMEIAMPVEALEAKGEPDIIYWEGPQDQTQAEGKGGGGLEESEPMMMTAPSAAEQAPIEKEAVPPMEESVEAAPQEPVEEAVAEEPAAEESLPEAMEVEAIEEGEQGAPTTYLEEGQLDANNLILGISPADERGNITVPTPIPIDAEDLPFPFWVLEIGFFIFAVGFGTAAYVLWRKTR